MGTEQIYTLVMGKRPFQWLWHVDYLVAQMIHFVEDLPDEWRLKWAKMKQEAGRKHEDILGIVCIFLHLLYVDVA